MYSDDIESISLGDITKRVREIVKMLNPFQKRIEEHHKRDDLYKITLERFANYTKEADKIQQRKSWIPEDKFKEA